MQRLRKTNLEEIIDFLNTSQKDSPSLGWILPRVKLADKYFNQNWSLVELNEEEALNNIILMHHKHLGGLELVQTSGEKLLSIIQKYKEIERDYSEKNPVCHKNIDSQKNANLSSLILTSKPVRGLGIEEHDSMRYTPPLLVHLDGLHRLVGWATSNKFRGGSLQAYLAGDVYD